MFAFYAVFSSICLAISYAHKIISEKMVNQMDEKKKKAIRVRFETKNPDVCLFDMKELDFYRSANFNAKSQIM